MIKLIRIALALSILLGVAACQFDSVTYKVGGKISGLAGALTLLNNGGDALIVNADGEFVFNTAMQPGSTYNVTVGVQPVQPVGWRCSVTNGTGIVYSSGVSVEVVCKDASSPVLVSVTTSELSGEKTLTANFTENVAVTGYCFKTFTSSLPEKPLSSDACFQVSNRYLMPSKQAVMGGTAAIGVPSTALTLTSGSLAVGQVITWAGMPSHVTVVVVGGSAPTWTLSSPQTMPSGTTINVTVPYYVWAKDAAGNVSATFCSSSSFQASDTSAYPTVCMMTSLGEMVFELNDLEAPITVANFINYVNKKSYRGLIFHRVTTAVVQGGGYLKFGPHFYGSLGTDAPIVLEPPSQTGLTHAVGTIAMARQTDLNSATSQFFVNVDSNDIKQPSWNGPQGYAVFGRLLYGYETLDAIKTLKVVKNVSGDPGPLNEVSLPEVPPVIERVLQLRCRLTPTTTLGCS